jgi:hypothetical protein
MRCSLSFRKPNASRLTAHLLYGGCGASQFRQPMVAVSSRTRRYGSMNSQKSRLHYSSGTRWVVMGARLVHKGVLATNRGTPRLAAHAPSPLQQRLSPSPCKVMKVTASSTTEISSPARPNRSVLHPRSGTEIAPFRPATLKRSILTDAHRMILYQPHGAYGAGGSQTMDSPDHRGGYGHVLDPRP